jgi:hypothetical protein
MGKGCRYQGVLYQGSRDADANREGMQCQGVLYLWSRDANTNEGMPMLNATR